MDVGATSTALEQLSTSVATAITFVQGLCQHHPRLTVIGLDLLLPAETTDGAIQRYMTSMRSQLRRQAGAFADCLGMIWATAMDEHNAPYIKLLVMFDGQAVLRDIQHGNWIGDYWSGVVTEGAGSYRNLNRLRQLGGGQGLGLISTRSYQRVGEVYYRLIYLMDGKVHVHSVFSQCQMRGSAN